MAGEPRHTSSLKSFLCVCSETGDSEDENDASRKSGKHADSDSWAESDISEVTDVKTKKVQL